MIYEVAYLHIKGVVKLLITKLRRYIVESVSEKLFKSVNIWQSYKQECGRLVNFLHL